MCLFFVFISGGRILKCDWIKMSWKLKNEKIWKYEIFLDLGWDSEDLNKSMDYRNIGTHNPPVITQNPSQFSIIKNYVKNKFCSWIFNTKTEYRTVPYFRCRFLWKKIIWPLRPNKTLYAKTNSSSTCYITREYGTGTSRYLY